MSEVIENILASGTDIRSDATYITQNIFSTNTNVRTDANYLTVNVLATNTNVRTEANYLPANVLTSDSDAITEASYLVEGAPLASGTDVITTAIHVEVLLTSDTDVETYAEYKPITISLGKVPFYVIIDLSFGTKVLKVELGKPTTVRRDVEIALPSVSYEYLWQTKEWFRIKVTNISKLREIFTVLTLRIHCSGPATGIKLTWDATGLMEFEDLSDGTAVIEVNLLEAPEKVIYAKQVVTGAYIENWKVIRIEIIAGSKGWPSKVEFNLTIHDMVIKVTDYTEEEPWWYDALVGFTIGSALTIGALALKAAAISPYTLVGVGISEAWIISIIFSMIQYRVRWHIALPVAILTLYFFTRILGR